MKISKELIEKYHNGTCSDEEKTAVEHWLLSDESEETVQWNSAVEKAGVQSEMWDEIASVLPPQRPAGIPSHRQFAFWRPLAAACVLAVFGAALYVMMHQTGTQVIALNNTSDTQNKNIREGNFTLSIAPRSNVEIDSRNGVMDFCGAVMINPGQDVELTIQGSCASPAHNIEKVSLKKGQNYIALHYGDHRTGEVIVVAEGAMAGLPPLVMRQLLHQFNI